MRQLPLVVCILCATALTLVGQNNSALRAGLSVSEVEALLGESVSQAYLKDKDYEVRHLYDMSPNIDYNHGTGTLMIYYSRGPRRAVRFEFRYINFSNGGKDPATGQEWYMTDRFVAACLDYFKDAKWRGNRQRLTSADGQMVATVSSPTVVITGR